MNMHALSSQWVCSSSVGLAWPPEHQPATPSLTLRAGLGEHLSLVFLTVSHTGFLFVFLLSPPGLLLSSCCLLCVPSGHSLYPHTFLTKVQGTLGWQKATLAQFFLCTSPALVFQLKAKITSPDFYRRGGDGHTVAVVTF